MLAPTRLGRLVVERRQRRGDGLLDQQEDVVEGRRPESHEREEVDARERPLQGDDGPVGDCRVDRRRADVDARGGDDAESVFRSDGAGACRNATAANTATPVSPSVM